MPTYLGLEASSWDADLSLVTKGGLTSFHKEIKQCHYVLGDTQADTEDTIALTSGVPQLGDVLRNTRCQKVTPKEVNTVRHPTTGVLCGLWKVECEYDNNLDAEQGDNNTGNQGGNDPTNNRPKKRWFTEKTTEILEFDRATGKNIQTTAGEPIHVENDEPQANLEIWRYERHPFDPDKIYRYTDKTNSQVFYGAPAGCALLDDISTDEEVIESVLYDKVTYTFRFRFKFARLFDQPGNPEVLLPDSHNIDVPNLGYLYKPRKRSSSGSLILGPAGVEGVAARTFVDANGQPKKVLLDADGALLPEGEEPLRIEVTKKYQTDFRPLDLDFQ